MGIKYCFSKNLITEETGWQTIDTEFEAENLKGNIIENHPWVEVEEDSRNNLLIASMKSLQDLRANKSNEISDYYSSDEVRQIIFKDTRFRADGNTQDYIQNKIDRLSIKEEETCHKHYISYSPEKFIELSLKDLIDLRIQIEDRRDSLNKQKNYHIETVLAIQPSYKKNQKDETIKKAYDKSLEEISTYDYTAK